MEPRICLLHTLKGGVVAEQHLCSALWPGCLVLPVLSHCWSRTPKAAAFTDKVVTLTTKPMWDISNHYRKKTEF